MASAASHRHSTKHHVLNFFHDDSDGCALTVLVNTIRFHIIADAENLRADSGPGAKLARDYRNILKQVKKQEKGDIPIKYSNDSDSGLESDGENYDSQRDSALGSSPPVVNDEVIKEEPVIALKRWMLGPFASIFEEQAPADRTKSEQKLDEWFSGPTLFYSLVIRDDKLVAEEEKTTPDLERRMQALAPHLPMPQYVMNLDVPLIPASKVIVLGCSDEPAPYHPSRVKIDQDTYFLKMCDTTQPQPTKRELKLLKEIEHKGLHEQFKVPLVKGLIGYENSKTEIMGFIMTEIDDPTPLTKLLDEDVPQAKREKWAKEADRITTILHDNKIVWGDAKADNFMVDANDDLWIIDFGGSYTEGWVDPELSETQEGDNMGVEKIVNALHDPVGMTMDEEEEQGKDQKRNAGQLSRKRKIEDLSEDGRSSHEEREGKSKQAKVDQQKDHQETQSEPGTQSEEASKPYDVRPPAEKAKRVAFERPKPDIQDNGDDPVEDEEENDLEEAYCVCNKPSDGEMICCDNDDCSNGQWFHFSCVGLREAPPEGEEWFCDECQ